MVEESFLILRYVSFRNGMPLILEWLCHGRFSREVKLNLVTTFSIRSLFSLRTEWCVITLYYTAFSRVSDCFLVLSVLQMARRIWAFAIFLSAVPYCSCHTGFVVFRWFFFFLLFHFRFQNRNFVFFLSFFFKYEISLKIWTRAKPNLSYMRRRGRKIPSSMPTWATLQDYRKLNVWKEIWEHSSGAEC